MEITLKPIATNVDHENQSPPWAPHHFLPYVKTDKILFLLKCLFLCNSSEFKILFSRKIKNSDNQNNLCDLKQKLREIFLKIFLSKEKTK